MTHATGPGCCTAKSYDEIRQNHKALWFADRACTYVAKVVKWSFRIALLLVLYIHFFPSPGHSIPLNWWRVVAFYVLTLAVRWTLSLPHMALERRAGARLLMRPGESMDQFTNRYVLRHSALTFLYESVLLPVNLLRWLWATVRRRQ